MRSIWIRRLAVATCRLAGLGLLGWLAPVACARLDPFGCLDDAGCDLGGLVGVCLGDEGCAYPDSTCESGLRHSPRAPRMSRECVAADPNTSTESGSDTDATACVDRDGDSFGEGPQCAGPDCDDDNPGANFECTYVGPLGSDSGAGTRDDPFLTFARATAGLGPGDSLVLLDGSYAQQVHGGLECNCDDDSGLPCFAGQPQAPLHIRAEHERRAILRSDAGGGTINFLSCDAITFQALTVVGPAALSEGAVAPVRVWNADAVTLDGLLVVGAGEQPADANLPTVHLRGLDNALVRDIEVYGGDYAGVSLHASRDSEIRRAYVHARGQSTNYGITVGSNERVRVHDVVTEGVIQGFDLRAGGAGSTDVRLAGGVFVGSDQSKYGLRVWSGEADALHGVVVSDVVTIGTRVGIRVDGGAGVVVSHATLLGATLGAIEAVNNESNYDCTLELCSYTARAILVEPPVLETGSFPFVGDPTPAYRAVIEDANVAIAIAQVDVDAQYPAGQGTEQGNTAIQTPAIGIEPGLCRLAIPEGSPMKGAAADGSDIGANASVRHVDGVATTTALWDPQTGEFPCGAAIPGLNDTPADSCLGVHTRVDPQACR